MKFNFIAVDFETATRDQMACQVGITIVENGEIKDTIVRLIQPPNNIYDRNCINVHHITPEQTIQAPTFAEVWTDIEPFFIDNVIVAHNAPFDESVLRKNLDYYGISYENINHFVCTYKIYGASLEVLCKAFKMSIDRHHDAGFDSLCCARFFLNFLQGIEPVIPISEIPAKHERQLPVFHERISGDVLKKDLTNANPQNPFYDKKVVITGVFTYDRKELAAILKEMGADIDTGVTKRTNFIAIGEDPGPAKLEKVESLIAEGYNIRKLYPCDLDKILAGDWEQYK